MARIGMRLRLPINLKALILYFLFLLTAMRVIIINEVSGMALQKRTLEECKTEFTCRHCGSTTCEIQKINGLWAVNCTKCYWTDVLGIADETEYGNYMKQKFGSLPKKVTPSEECVVVECPYCHSTNTKKISGSSRVASFLTFGLAGKKVGKQWHCNKCGSDF